MSARCQNTFQLKKPYKIRIYLKLEGLVGVDNLFLIGPIIVYNRLIVNNYALISTYILILLFNSM